MRKQQKDTIVHIIGIGGIGMSAIAEVLLQLGFQVQGSDMAESANVENLRAKGAKITIGQKAENIQGATVITHSSAVKEGNPEYDAAVESGLPLLRRAQMLADIMRIKKGIAIAGTHGKTTTTSLVSTLLTEIGADPTYIIGGIVHNLGGHAKVGKGEYFVAEADESDGSFLMLSPVASVITNIDNDHLDHYGTEEGLQIAFHRFANQIPFFGICSLNYEDPKLRKIAEEMDKPMVTFAADPKFEDADYLAYDLNQSEKGVEFGVKTHGKDLGKFMISTPGKHNVLNALGALSVCIELGFDPEELKKGLRKFEGVGRRFQKVYEENDFEVIDDYGHHPTEIFETIKTAKASRSDKEVIVVFEPHRFTRTRDCWKEFLHCFNLADKVYIAPIYSANEKPIPGINSGSLSSDINKLHPGLTETFEDWDKVKEVVEESKSKKVLLLALGAGGVGKRVKNIVSPNS